MRASRENAAYLPGYRLQPSIAITTDVAEAVRGARIVLGVTPTHAVRDVFGRAAASLAADAVVVNASKGLEEGTLKRIDQIYADVLPAAVSSRAVFLSGPTFAREVAAALPSAIVIAGHDHAAVALVQSAFATERFRVYSSDDVVGVQLGGALKNVVAICAGVSDGLGAGQNARAALITRGLAEISRIGVKLGANPLTFAGLSGLGDLVLTCAGELSRNRQVGLALAGGKQIGEIVAEMRMVAEGIKTTKVARELAAELGVEAPLIEWMYGVLYEGRDVRAGVGELMTRTLKHERA
jgi:glycerol-3-phosphate dehydrogenase (NAD(P)+)